MPDGRLEYMQTVDILPEGEPVRVSPAPAPADRRSAEHEDDREQYRGDTVRISPSGTSILATTRGKTAGVRGFVRAWALHPNSVVDDPNATVGGPIGALKATFETPSSGGKANAIEWAPRYPLMASPEEQGGVDGSGEHDLAVLTDDEQGHVLVLSWDGSDLKELARVTLPGTGDDGRPEGASHAVWLS
jgi:carboxy-cis,cis-muconate cyclase